MAAEGKLRVVGEGELRVAAEGELRVAAEGELRIAAEDELSVEDGEWSGGTVAPGGPMTQPLVQKTTPVQQSENSTLQADII